MRARTLLLTLASVSSLVLIGAAGCGETDDPKPATPAADATPDTKPATDAKAEAAPVVCLDADITTVEIPDAPLGDAGQSVGGCVSCIKANCASELDACQEDCDCRESVLSFFTCVGKGSPITTCGGGLITAGSMAQSLGLCALNAGCTVVCGAGGDAGPNPPNDAASDAPADSPADGG